MTNEQREALDRLNKDKKCSLDYEGYITIVRVADLDTVLFLTKKQEKQLDLMAEYIANRDNDEDICRHQVAEWCKDEEDGVLVEVCRKCIKQYFANKVDSKIQ